MSSYCPQLIVTIFVLSPCVLGYLIVFGNFWYHCFEVMGSVCWVLRLGLELKAILFGDKNKLGQKNCYTPLS